MLLLFIGAAVVTVALWYYFVKPLSYWSDMGVHQTKPWIIFGDSWMTMFRTMAIYEFVQWLYNLYPNERYVGWYNFRSPVLHLRDPELIKQIAIKDFESFTDHAPFLDPDADPLWSKTLFALRGERWKEMRNLVSPTFTSSKIKGLYILMEQTAEDFVKYFQKKDEEIIELDMKDAFTRFTNDIIATTAFGVKVDSLENPKNTFYEMGKKLTDIGGIIRSLAFILSQGMPALAKLLGIRFLNETAAQYFYGVIDDTIKEREEKKIVRPDMIHLLLEARRNQISDAAENAKSDGKPKRIVEITNSDITSQAAIFFFAGFDTVSTAMCFGAYELALNKDVQDRLRREIRQTAKNGKVSYDALQQMSYMDMVISETVRKWPPFGSIDRLCTKSYTIEPSNRNEKPVHIQKDHEVWFPIYALHRDPKYFPDPEKFDPERFSEENKDKIVPYSYIPFGVGPRICIGNRFALVEIKALFFNLLLNFEVVPIKKTAIPLVLKKDFQLSAEGGFWLGLKRIKAEE